MLELRSEQPPPRAELLRSLAARLHHVVPGFRPIAEDLLADRSRIDLFGSDAQGCGVLSLLGEREEDGLLLLGRALAQRAWVEERLGDWLKLAPALGVRPEAPLRSLLLCPGFGSEVRVAARALPEGALTLVAWRFVRNGSGTDVLLERIDGDAAGVPPGPAADAPAQNRFRTGLSDRDLGLSDAERAEFE